MFVGTDAGTTGGLDAANEESALLYAQVTDRCPDVPFAQMLARRGVPAHSLETPSRPSGSDG